MKEIQLTNSPLVALVDDEDYDRVKDFNWSLNNGYAHARWHGETVFMHRLLLNLFEGDKEHVDHQNYNRLDNRKSNIRKCSRRQNQHHQLKRKGITTSKFRGVHMHRKKWIARIKINSIKNQYLGMFTTEQEAALVYNEAAKQLHGNFAQLNTL